MVSRDHCRFGLKLSHERGQNPRVVVHANTTTIACHTTEMRGDHSVLNSTKKKHGHQTRYRQHNGEASTTHSGQLALRSAVCFLTNNLSRANGISPFSSSRRTSCVDCFSGVLCRVREPSAPSCLRPDRHAAGTRSQPTPPPPHRRNEPARTLGRAQKKKTDATKRKMESL